MPVLGALEIIAMRHATLGGARRDLMPQTFDGLLARGLIAEDGLLTPAGSDAWAAHLKAGLELGLRTHVLPTVSADTMAALGRLISGRSPQGGDWELLRPHAGSLVLDDPGKGWKVTDTGRHVYSLACGRTT